MPSDAAVPSGCKDEVNDAYKLMHEVTNWLM